MAGLLDFLGTASGQGLLSAVAGGLAGARRGQPINSLGRAGLAGLAGYSQANEDRLKMDELKRLNEMRDLQQQQAQLQFNEQQTAANFYKPENLSQYNTPGTPERTTVAAGPLFAQEALGLTPDYTTQVTPAKPAAFDLNAFAQGKINSGSSGLAKEGIAQLETLRKASVPKVKDWKEVRIGDRVLFKPYFEDGTSGQPVDADVASKLSFQDTGGSIAALNPFTGLPVGSPIAKSQSPESVASINAQLRGQNLTNARASERFNFDKLQGGKPTFNADAGGYIYPPSSANPEGKIVKTPGFEGSKTLQEGERKAATLLKRLDFSEKQLQTALGEDPKAAKPGVIASGIRTVGLDALANTVATPQARQRVEAAQLDILDSALTLGTGAAYTREQLESYRASYFPQLGDDPKTVTDKEARLKNVIEAAKIAAGRAAPENNRRANDTKPAAVDSLLEKYK